MADYISRKAAIDAILHNQELYSNNFGNDPIDKYTIAIIDNDAKTIAQLPSAQPEIIRCKECRWYKTNYMWNGTEVKICAKEAYEPSRKADDYCSHAERRGDG